MAPGLQSDLEDDDIDRWIRALESLTEGDLAVSALVGCAARAIGPLREFLMHGRPSTVFQPRQRAVRALGELGAVHVLIEYLRMNKPISDPAVRFGEEAVENTAARALAQWKTDEVYAALLETARERHLVGVIEALGEFDRGETVPCLIAALEDDFCRRSAEDAMRRLGVMAKAALIETARTPDPSRATELPSSLRRRRSAMRILVDMPLAASDWLSLQALLYDQDPEILVVVSRIALRFGTPNERLLAVKKLLNQLPTSDWLLEAEIQDAMVMHYELARTAVEQALAARQPVVRAHGYDRVAELLSAIKSRAEAHCSKQRMP